MTISELIDEAILNREEADRRITKADVIAFRALSLADKKTTFLALAENQQLEMLGRLSVTELETIKVKLAG